jgi:hypothetical protein
MPRPSKYYVASGELEIIVLAFGTLDAAEVAIKQSRGGQELGDWIYVSCFGFRHDGRPLYDEEIVDSIKTDVFLGDLNRDV